MAQGLFITFEGGEGAGKSTQVARLAKRFDSMGRAPILTREPGGSAGAEAIRQILVTGSTDRWSAVTEALLMNAARKDHIERVIAPALAAGGVVICDRFADSTRAYQGVAGGVAPPIILALESIVVGETRPDLTVIIDLPVEAGLSRARARADQELRFENKGEDFHRRLRAAFIEIARQEPDRCVVVDGQNEPDVVESEIWRHVEAKL